MKVPEPVAGSKSGWFAIVRKGLTVFRPKALYGKIYMPAAPDVLTLTL